MKTATQRTLDYLRAQGWTCQVVEKWVSFKSAKAPTGSNTPGRSSPGVRKDLFGFVDLVAIKKGCRISAVQCFTTDWEGHVRKLLDTPEIRDAALAWASGGDVFLFGWRKVKPRGEKVVKVRPRIGVLRAPSPWNSQVIPIVEEINEDAFRSYSVPF